MLIETEKEIKLKGLHYVNRNGPIAQFVEVSCFILSIYKYKLYNYCIISHGSKPRWIWPLEATAAAPIDSLKSYKWVAFRCICLMTSPGHPTKKLLRLSVSSASRVSKAMLSIWLKPSMLWLRTIQNWTFDFKRCFVEAILLYISYWRITLWSFIR